ncbi:MAG: hypothetical protein JNL81_15255 [Hyphomonadaceae bacterium]|nr:hypothetical protein [Hyphomonadaceae bacterium]
MIRKRTAAALAIGVILVALGAACAPTQVAINARLPANFPEAAELRRISVAPFEGNGGADFTGAMRAEIVAATFDGQRHFTLVDGLSSPSASAARQANAQGILTGSVFIDRSRNNFREGRRECSARNNDHECVRWHEYEVNCTAETVSALVSPNLLRASDGASVYASQKRGERTSRWCTDRQRNTTDEAMIAAILANIATEVRRDIAPYNSVLNATVSETSDGLPRALAAQFDLAVDAAKASNVTAACETWRSVDAAQPNHTWTVYNLGICAEAQGDYVNAQALYQRASQLGGASNRQVVASIQRVGRLMGAEQQLAAEETARRLESEAQARRAEEAAQRLRATQNARRSDLVSRHGVAVADAILAGQVSAGMTPQQVLEARGQPSRREDLTPTEQIWHYGSERVMFSNGRVTFVRR